MVPNLDIDETGDYSLSYDMTQLERKDYYGKDPYCAFSFGQRPLLEITNLSGGEDKKILIIHQSFALPVLTNMALGVKNIYSLELDKFTGSVKT